MPILPIILAAGKGSRMHSSIPKVLHPIGGKPMLKHVIDACNSLDVSKLIVVYGHGGDLVRDSIRDDNIEWILQKEQKGTGHAVAQASARIDDDSVVVVAYGDVPLIKTKTLNQLASKLSQSDLVVLTTKLENPTGYGRIVRDSNGEIIAIVEEKDASDKQRLINEINTGFVAAKGKDIKRWLSEIRSDNMQNEYYLTDCIALAVAEGKHVESVLCNDFNEVQGVNDRFQQATLERVYQQEQARKLLEAGATLFDPSRLDVRGELTIGKDVVIDVNTIFIGNVSLGDNVKISSGCVIQNALIGDNVTIKANSVIDSAQIDTGCEVGPFARIRPETHLKPYSKVGNFVEIKKSTIGKGSKVSHLSYIGDTQMGQSVNIGAGTITCNYDGANKFQTTIGDNVFVGSDTQLIAPVDVANGTTIGAGSTITKDTPENELTLSRAKQVTIKGWQRPLKKESE